MRWTELPEFKSVPAGWEVVSLLRKTTFIAGQSPSSELYNASGQGPPFLQGNADFGERHPHPLVFCGQPTKTCEVGDTLISVRAPVGEINRADQVYGLGRGLGALQAKEMDSDYLFYGMHRWRRPLSRAAQGSTFDAVTGRHFKQLRVAIPTSRKEQERIVEIISAADQAAQLCDVKLGAAKSLKTALMQQLFARGIPGRHNKFKQTKIGEIPEEWEVLRIQQVLDGPPFSGVSPQSRYEPPGTPILNVSCIYDGRCDPAQVSYVDVDDATFVECRARKGDFYVLRGNGNRDYVATGGYLSVEPDPPCIFSDKLIRIRFKPDLIAESFIPMMWQSSAFLRRFQSKAESGSGLWMMSKRDIRREFFARPKMDEQEEIVSLVTAADDNIASVEREIKALRKLKTSLLQNLLTGKVRVKMKD